MREAIWRALDGVGQLDQQMGEVGSENANSSASFEWRQNFGRQG